MAAAVVVRGCIVKRCCRAISSGLCSLSFFHAMLASSRARILEQRRLSGFLRLFLIESDEKRAAQQRRGNQRVGFASPSQSISLSLSLSANDSVFLHLFCPDFRNARSLQKSSQEIRVLLGNGSTNLAGNRSVDRVVSTALDEIRVHADPRRLFSRWRAHRLSVSSSLVGNTHGRLFVGISNATSRHATIWNDEPPPEHPWLSLI